MSKQPRSSRDIAERLRANGIVLTPEHQDPRQCWLVVRQDPADGQPGCFFVSHGMNIDKWSTKKGFEVLAKTFDRMEATRACRRATEVCGEAYQPPFSVKPGSGPLPSAEEPDLYDDLAEGPQHDLDSFIRNSDPEPSN